MANNLYIDGQYKSTEANNISTMMQAFNYGTAAFEGMKAFYLEDEKDWFLFRPDQYYKRLQRSTAMIDIKFAMSLNEFVKVISTLIKKNNMRSDVYIRPLVFRNQKGVGLTKPSDYGVSIFVQTSPYSSANKFRCCFVSQRRPIDGTFSVKLSGNYLLSYFSHKEAERRGFDVGILLSSTDYVSEASVMNLFFAEKGKLFTPSLDCGPLGGITRSSIIQIAKEELGIKVTDGKYRPDRLLEADEIFFTGTGSGVNYVRQLEKRKFTLKGPKLLAPELLRLYQEITRGKNGRFRDWLVPLT